MTWARVAAAPIPAALLVVSIAMGVTAAEPDYLGIGLRAEVARLKRDLPTTPTTAVNRSARATTLLSWANAFAINGGTLPVDLTATAGIILAYPDVADGRETYLDAFIRELAFLDDHPGALGTLRADPGPYTAGGHATIRQTYTVGSRAITPGGGFLLGRHFLPNIGRWQATAPGADNYVDIRTDDQATSFVVEETPMPCMAPCMHGGFRRIERALFFGVAAGSLDPGTQVTLTYGDTSGGSHGLRMPTFATDRMPLPLYVAFDDEREFLTLPIQPVAIAGTEVAGVHGFAPSIVAVDEPFTLTVRAQDEYYNRATGPLPAWRVLHNGAPFAELPADGPAIARLEQVHLATPGVHRFQIESRDGTIRGESNPMLVEAEPAERIYWGDTHGHSGFAEGIGSADRFMTWARDDASLDYVVHSEHDLWLDDAEWEALKSNVVNYSVEGRFVAFLGYEWTVNNLQGGHHNVLFRTAAYRRRVPMHFFPTLSRLYAALRSQNDLEDVVVIPHAHQSGDYRQSDPGLETLVEIMSQHGTFEWFGNQYLQHGHQVGFTAASDTHLGQPGYSAPVGGSLSQRGGLGAVMAASRTRNALFDALRARHGYATSGERMILRVRVNGVHMGRRAPFSRERVIAGTVVGTAPIEEVTVFRNGEPVWLERHDIPEKDQDGRYVIVFASDSKPAQPGDNPRGWRTWQGSATVTGATVADVALENFHNQRHQSLSWSPDAPDRFDFATITRGNTNRLVLDLADVRRNAAIVIELAAATEFGGGPPVFRSHAELPASTVRLPLADTSGDGVTRTVPLDDAYVDTVTLRAVRRAGPREADFEFTETRNVQGDYYHVRVRQVDDAVAWSSPVWIGGYPSR